MPLLICIRTYPSRTFAEFVKSTLEANGISSMVSAEDTGYDLTYSSGGARLLIDEKDVDRVEELLAEIQEEPIDGHWAQTDDGESEDVANADLRRVKFRRWQKMMIYFGLVALLAPFVFHFVRTVVKLLLGKT